MRLFHQSRQGNLRAPSRSPAVTAMARDVRRTATSKPPVGWNRTASRLSGKPQIRLNRAQPHTERVRRKRSVSRSASRRVCDFLECTGLLGLPARCGCAHTGFIASSSTGPGGRPLRHQPAPRRGLCPYGRPGVGSRARRRTVDALAVGGQARPDPPGQGPAGRRPVAGCPAVGRRRVRRRRPGHRADADRVRQEHSARPTARRVEQIRHQRPLLVGQLMRPGHTQKICTSDLDPEQKSHTRRQADLAQSCLASRLTTRA